MLHRLLFLVPLLAAAEPPPTTVRLALREMRILAEGLPRGAPLTLVAGRRYELRFHNAGQLEHEVAFGRGETRGADGPRFAQDLLAGIPTDVHAPGLEAETLGLSELELGPGARARVSFTLPESAAGDWELACFMPGHHSSGMRLKLRVLRPAVSAAR